jgi:PPOX class probable F420-dependent enzyme
VEVAEGIAFVRSNHRAVLATTRADGAVQMSPVVAAVDDEDRVVVSTRETALKTAHVRRTGRAALLALPESFFGNWVQVEGPVEIVPLPEAMAGLEAYYRQVSGEHPDWEEYHAAMERERRVLLRVTVERAGPSRSG